MEATERKARRNEDAAGEGAPRRRGVRRSIIVDGLVDPGLGFHMLLSYVYMGWTCISPQAWRQTLYFAVLI
jgi:hypothetical protein